MLNISIFYINVLMRKTGMLIELTDLNKRQKGASNKSRLQCIVGSSEKTPAGEIITIHEMELKMKR